MFLLKTHIFLLRLSFLDIHAFSMKTSGRKLSLNYGTRFVYLNIDRLQKYNFFNFFVTNPEPIF